MEGLEALWAEETGTTAQVLSLTTVARTSTVADIKKV